MSAPVSPARATADRPAVHRTASLRSSLAVLLATDGSGAARVAEEWILRLRWASPPVVDVLCVARPRRLATRVGLPTYRPDVQQAVTDLRQADLLAALRVANSVAERLQRSRFRTRTWARSGTPASEVRAMVQAEKPDLLVLGSEGRSGRFSPPDLLSRVVAHVDAAILVTRSLEEGSGQLPRRFGVMVGSGSASELLDWPTRAGWLDGIATMQVAPDGMDGLSAQDRPDLVVVGRQPGASLADAVHRGLDTTSAVLVPPRTPRYDPSQELGV